MLEYPKKIAWWCGTDALKLIKFPPSNLIWKVRIVLHRIFWRIFHRFFEHWGKSGLIISALREFGIERARLISNKDYLPDKVEKNLDPDYFFLLFYRPRSKSNQRYKDWVCGWDLYNTLCTQISKLDNVLCIVVEGNADMDSIYTKIDFYVRLNRWDGDPRMIIECEVNEIPYYYDRNCIPNINKASEMIKEKYEKKFNSIHSV